MPFIIIPFLVKGAIIAGKAIIAHHKVGAVIKTTSAIIQTHGVVATAQAGAVVLMTIGGIEWTADRVDDAKAIYKSWENKDYAGMVKRTASLFSKVTVIYNNPQTFVHSFQELLKAHGYDNAKVLQFINDLSNAIDDILDEMKKKR